jgi:Protein of unknown function (DUF2938)
MHPTFELLCRAILIGIGATAAMDLWAQFLKRCFGVPSLSWNLVGRWIGQWPRGRFVNDNIANAGPLRNERAIGWIAHYVTGIVFAAALLMLKGSAWADRPTLLPALALGLVTVVFPFFVMQPAMGAGIMASKTPNPRQARLRSLATHAIFGVGLYISALLLTTLT